MSAKPTQAAVRLDAIRAELPIALAGLPALWQSKCVRDSFPRRTDFPARELKPWISNIAIIEAVGMPRRFRIRLMGSGCVRIAGADNTGRWIDECSVHAHRDQLVRDYDACLDEAVPMISIAEFVTDHVRRTTIFRLYLPCKGDGDATDTIMVAVHGFDDLGKTDPDMPVLAPF